MLICSHFPLLGGILMPFPHLHNAHSVEELKNEEREKGEEKFCIFHMELTVAATVFCLFWLPLWLTRMPSLPSLCARVFLLGQKPVAKSKTTCPSFLTPPSLEAEIQKYAIWRIRKLSRHPHECWWQRHPRPNPLLLPRQQLPGQKRETGRGRANRDRAQTAVMEERAPFSFAPTSKTPRKTFCSPLLPP